jgi:hypothetical protein
MPSLKPGPFIGLGISHLAKAHSLRIASWRKKHLLLHKVNIYRDHPSTRLSLKISQEF